MAGEAAGLALGLLFAGSGSERSAEMLAYAHDTQHEKIIRGLAVGLALVQVRQQGQGQCGGTSSDARAWVFVVLPMRGVCVECAKGCAAGRVRGAASRVLGTAWLLHLR